MQQWPSRRLHVRKVHFFVFQMFYPLSLSLQREMLFMFPWNTFSLFLSYSLRDAFHFLIKHISSIFLFSCRLSLSPLGMSRSLCSPFSGEISSLCHFMDKFLFTRLEYLNSLSFSANFSSTRCQFYFGQFLRNCI